MISRKTNFFILFAVFCLAFNIYAGDRVSIRLVEASNNGSNISSKLQDVHSILQSQIAYKNYNLVGSTSCQLPADQTLKMAYGFKLKCSGKQQNFTLSVKQKKVELLKTTLNLKDGKPVVLGGFPHGKSKLLLILLVK